MEHLIKIGILLSIVISCGRMKTSNCNLIYMDADEFVRTRYSSNFFSSIIKIANEEIERIVDLPDTLNFLTLENSILSCRWILPIDSIYIGEFFITVEDERCVLLVSFSKEKNIIDILSFQQMKKSNGERNTFFSHYYYKSLDSISVLSLDTSIHVLHPSKGKICEEYLWILNKQTGVFEQK